MIEIKHVVFCEDINTGFEGLIKRVYDWYICNKTRLTIISSVYGSEYVEHGDELKYDPKAKEIDITTGDANSEIFDTLINEGISEFRRSIYIRFIGIEGIDPDKCKHEEVESFTTPATCYMDGSIKIICKLCGTVIKTTIIPKLGHNYVYVDDKNANCTENGTETGTCTRCSHKITHSIPGTALGHNYVYTSDGNANCTEDGTETGTCTRCSHKVTRPDSGTALGHNYVYVKDNNANCTEDGTETGTCTRCRHKVTRPDIGTALGHDMPTEWTVQTPPSYEYMGLEVKHCKRVGCDHELTQNIPRMVHKWVSHDDGTHTCTTVGGCGVTEGCYPNGYGDTCAKCGYKFPSDIVLEITTGVISEMKYDLSFSQTLETNAPADEVTWTCTTVPSLPPGILFDGGVLYGIPTAGGSYTFTIKAEYNGQVVNKTYTIEVKSALYTITFDPVGGVCAEASRVVPQGKAIGTLPVATLKGYGFDGWYTGLEDGTLMKADVIPTESITLYARWGISWGPSTRSFDILYKGRKTSSRTDDSNRIYTRISSTGGTDPSNVAKFATQVGIESIDGTNNLTATNNIIKVHIKMTNNGVKNIFDITIQSTLNLDKRDPPRTTIERVVGGVIIGEPYYSITGVSRMWIGNPSYTEYGQLWDNSGLYKWGLGGDMAIGQTGFNINSRNISLGPGESKILTLIYTFLG